MFFFFILFSIFHRHPQRIRFENPKERKKETIIETKTNPPNLFWFYNFISFCFPLSVSVEVALVHIEFVLILPDILKSINNENHKKISLCLTNKNFRILKTKSDQKIKEEKKEIPRTHDKFNRTVCDITFRYERTKEKNTR